MTQQFREQTPRHNRETTEILIAELKSLRSDFDCFIRKFSTHFLQTDQNDDFHLSSPSTKNNTGEEGNCFKRLNLITLCKKIENHTL